MRYLEFRTATEQELLANPDGLTWAPWKARLALPYSVPYYTWIAQLAAEIGLTRTKTGRSMAWRLNGRE